MAEIEPDALVEAAMKGSGATSPTELARELGLTDYSAPRNIKRWLDGENAPGYEATLLLLRAAGMLNLEKPTPGSRGATDPVLAELRALDRKIDREVVPRLDAIADKQRTASSARR